MTSSALPLSRARANTIKLMTQIARKLCRTRLAMYRCMGPRRDRTVCDSCQVRRRYLARALLASGPRPLALRRVPGRTTSVRASDWRLRAQELQHGRVERLRVVLGHHVRRLGDLHAAAARNRLHHLLRGLQGHDVRERAAHDQGRTADALEGGPRPLRRVEGAWLPDLAVEAPDDLAVRLLLEHPLDTGGEVSVRRARVQAAQERARLVPGGELLRGLAQLALDALEPRGIDVRAHVHDQQGGHAV